MMSTASIFALHYVRKLGFTSMKILFLAKNAVPSVLRSSIYLSRFLFCEARFNGLLSVSSTSSAPETVSRVRCRMLSDSPMLDSLARYYYSWFNWANDLAFGNPLFREFGFKERESVHCWGALLLLRNFDFFSAEQLKSRPDCDIIDSESH